MRNHIGIVGNVDSHWDSPGKKLANKQEDNERPEVDQKKKRSEKIEET